MRFTHRGKKGLVEYECTGLDTRKSGGDFYLASLALQDGMAIRTGLP